MHGSAKYSTKVLRPGIASSGSMRRRAASQPHSTSAKNGKVTSRMSSTPVFSSKRGRGTARRAKGPAYDSPLALLARSPHHRISPSMSGLNLAQQEAVNHLHGP